MEDEVDSITEEVEAADTDGSESEWEDMEEVEVDKEVDSKTKHKGSRRESKKQRKKKRRQKSS